MWERAVDGRTLQFRLIGINNQNFLMEDRETGSWWQQITGEAIAGPLEGRHLTQVLHDEVTLGLWRTEHPLSRVLGLDAKQSQISSLWEANTGKAPVVTTRRPNDPLDARALVVGVEVNGAARAYPRETVATSRVTLDDLSGVPLAILQAGDDHSLRVFSRVVNGTTVDLLDRVDSSPARYIDGQTGSEFDFSGRAVSGPLAGAQLQRIPHVSDYWFDWSRYHPSTTVYTPWRPAAGAAR